MAAAISGEDQLRKRKRDSNNEKSVYEAEVQELCGQIHNKSPPNYNAIKSLLKLARKEATPELKGRNDATYALSSIFTQLNTESKLARSTKPSGADAEESTVSDWLTGRYQTYLDLLFERLTKPKLVADSLDILMHLIRTDFSGIEKSFESQDGIFSRLLHYSLSFEGFLASRVCEKVASSAFKNPGHIIAQTFAHLARFLREERDSWRTTENALLYLSSPLLSWDSRIALEQSSSILPVRSSAERKHAQSAWLALLNRELTKDQRKKILSSMMDQILPWFQRIEVLMDFLTDSFDQGGATSLLALESLFLLIQEKNLDYPDFYFKLYSLLDDNILHSKHRSRFFRLLKTFMSSTHLPAALVASFIKRLSRLSLHAPPAGIVAVVPWVYNMLKTHPTCTFMIHREPRTPEQKKEIEEQGVEDPFDMNETDPMNTNAIESSLWEIETLRSHYHPNVASIANLISEQFTKQSYDLEDFLDHSYSSLLDSELRKPLKKPPVVEFQIPKTIFKDDLGDDHLEVLLKAAMAAS